MTSETFTLEAYFHRIGYAGTPAVTLQTLRDVMRAQLRTVPFENSEVQAGRIPSLEGDDVYEKIVKRGGGGYCYEVNGLFAMALEAMGFAYYFIGARPMFYPQRRPKTHMVVAVELDGESYLCDTGFGGYGLRAPLRIVEASKSEEDGEYFQLRKEGREYVFESLVGGEWVPQYGFEPVEQEFIEFSLANHFNATHPETIFTQKKLAVLQTSGGRMILMDDRLKIVEKGVVREEKVDFASAARHYFGLLV